MLGDPPPAVESQIPPARHVPDGRAPAGSTWWHAPEWPEDDDATTTGVGERFDRPAADLPDPWRIEARRHRTVLAVSCGVVALAFAMVEVPGGRVAFRGLTDHPLPHTCTSRALFGWSCPGCGLTRSIIHLAAGDWRASWRRHRLGTLMAAVIAFQVPYRLLALRRPAGPPIPAGWQTLVAAALVALLLLNWLAEVVTARIGSV
jgi:hypothetical protein